MLLLLTFLECLEKTTQFMLDSPAKAKLTLRLNIKLSTFPQLMELEVWPSAASSVLMVHSSTRTISSVTGCSTLTAPLLRISTLSLMTLLLNVDLSQKMHLMFRKNMMLLLLIIRLCCSEMDINCCFCMQIASLINFSSHGVHKKCQEM